MNTRNMPNMAKALAGSLDQNTIKALMQSLGNCAQPLSHNGGMNVNGPVTFGGSKNIPAGDFRGGDMNQTIYGDDNRSWSADDNRQFISTLEEYSNSYTNEYNEGDVWTQYNDNSVWDQSQWSRTTNYNMATHITQGDQYSFPTTNYREEYSFTEGNRVTFEGDVTHKALTINEGDQVLNITNEGDTTNITNQGDTFTETTNNITETINEINNTYEGDQHYHTHVHNRFITEITNNIVNQITNQHTHIHQYFNDYITNVIIRGPGGGPRRQAGPWLDCGSPLKAVETVGEKPVSGATCYISQDGGKKDTGNVDLSNGTIVLTGDITFDQANCSVSHNLQAVITGTANLENQLNATNQTVPLPDQGNADIGTINATVEGKTCSGITGPGLAMGNPTPVGSQLIP